MISISLYQLGWSDLTAEGLDPRTVVLLSVAWLAFMLGSLAFRASREEVSPPALRGSTVALPVREEGLAILSCILFFSFFDNMISYSLQFLQLLPGLLRGRYRVGWL